MCRAHAGAPDFSVLDTLLQSHVADRTFPGATYVLANVNGVLHQGQVGSFVYAGDAPPPHSGGVNPPMDVESTLFDLASLTKIVATTAATAGSGTWATSSPDSGPPGSPNCAAASGAR